MNVLSLEYIKTLTTPWNNQPGFLKGKKFEHTFYERRYTNNKYKIKSQWGYYTTTQMVKIKKTDSTKCQQECSTTGTLSSHFL